MQLTKMFSSTVGATLLSTGLLTTGFLALSTAKVQAEPYINTDDLSLRVSLRQLADAGHIKIPLNTYPLMWNDVIKAVNMVDPGQLKGHDTDAYFHVKAEFNKAKRKQSKITANVASHDNRFTSFGDTFRNKNNLEYSISDVFTNFAYKLSPSVTSSDDDGDEFRFDDSYIAGKIGNWNIALGTQDRWWGPGWDSNLSLTNNARPIPALAITRNTSEPFEVPFTNGYEIPWNVTSFMGRMESDRTVPNTLLWGFRLNFIPLDNLELGIVRLVQWGGDGRSNSLSTFFDAFIGRDNCGNDGLNCGPDNVNEPGNQMAGYDARYAFNLFDTPFAIYGQYIGEDGGTSNLIADVIKQVGFETQIKLFNQPIKMYLEGLDTLRACGEDLNQFNCIYEHHIYQTGLRFNGRNINSLYDNDAKTVVFGLSSQNYSNQAWDIKFRYLELNKDNLDRFPNDPRGNTLTEVAEDVLMVSGNYHRHFKRYSYKVSASYSQSDFIDQDDRSEANLAFEFSYHL